MILWLNLLYHDAVDAHLILYWNKLRPKNSESGSGGIQGCSPVDCKRLVIWQPLKKAMEWAKNIHFNFTSLNGRKLAHPSAT